MLKSSTFFSRQPNDEFFDAIKEIDINKIKQILSKMPEDKKTRLVNSEFSCSGRTILSHIAREEKAFPDDEKTRELMKVLMSAGADPAVRDFGEEANTHLFSNTTLLNAIAAQKWGHVCCLIDQYDPKLHKDYINMTSLASTAKNSPLIFALKKQVAPLDVIRALLMKGADPNFQNHLLETPLHYAAFYANDDLLTLLLEYGADLSKQNKDGIIPFDLYAANYFPKVDSIDIGHIATEEQDLPVFYYEKNSDTRAQSVQPHHYGIFFGHARNILNDIDNLKYNANTNFHSISMRVELIFPNGVLSARGYEKTPNKMMLQKLKPIGYDEDALIELFKKTKKEYARHGELIQTGKYILHSDIPVINQLLNILNKYIKDIKDMAEPLQLLEARLEVATSNSIYTAEKKFFNTMYSHIETKIKEEFKQECETIHKIRLNKLISALEKSNTPEWHDLVLRQENTTLNPGDKVVFIVKQLIEISEQNNNPTMKQTLDTILKETGIHETERKTIQQMDISFALKPQPGCLLS